MVLLASLSAFSIVAFSIASAIAFSIVSSDSLAARAVPLSDAFAGADAASCLAFHTSECSGLVLFRLALARSSLVCSFRCLTTAPSWSIGVPLLLRSSRASSFMCSTTVPCVSTHFLAASRVSAPACTRSSATLSAHALSDCSLASFLRARSAAAVFSHALADRCWLRRWAVMALALSESDQASFSAVFSSALASFHALSSISLASLASPLMPTSRLLANAIVETAWSSSAPVSACCCC